MGIPSLSVIRTDILTEEQRGGAARRPSVLSEFLYFADVFIQPLEVIDVDSAVAIGVGNA